MELELSKFMENITLINKDYSLYKNEEKGVMFYVNTVQLLVKVENLELSSEEYKIKRFEGSVEELDYNIVEVDRPQSKYKITKKEEDRYTIVNSKVSVRQVWNVSNAVGIYKSFTNKEDAMKYALELNDKTMEKLT